MKKFILISFLFVISCGSRNVDKSKSIETNKGSLEIVSQQKSKQKESVSSEITNNEKENTENTESLEKQHVQQQSNENISDKSSSESSKKIYKNTEYYENGQKKSETEYSEDIKTVSKERDYYMSSAISLSKSLSLKEQSLRKEISKREILEKKLENSEQKNLKINQEYNQYKLERTNKTERKFVSLWWLYILVGIIIGKFGWDILKFIWQKAKSSQWYLHLLERLNNTR